MKPMPNINRSGRRYRRVASGFTLVEMLLVLVILGLLAAIVYPNVANKGEYTRGVTTRAQIKSMQTALSAFEMDNGYFPTGQNSLQTLVVQPSDAPGWHGPYLENIPKDGWGSDYHYECPGKHNPGGYDVVSPGPDRQMGTPDDIGNWPPASQ